MMTTQSRKYEQHTHRYNRRASAVCGRSLNGRQLTRKLTPGDDGDFAGALLQVASPPIGAKTNYVGPTLLCLRLGLNRSGSAENCWHGDKNSEGPRSELAVRNGNGLAYVKIVSSRV
jgi:hypothetical protein